MDLWLLLSWWENCNHDELLKLCHILRRYRYNFILIVRMSKLQEIVEHKKQELQQQQSDWYHFLMTFASKAYPGVIAEIKLSSPSFDLSDKISWQQLAHAYIDHDEVRAISILTDKKYFSWDITRATYIKNHTSKPLLFKEFVISTKQIDGAYFYGYDACLLIKKCLSDDELLLLTLYAQAKWICPVVEIDNSEDLAIVIQLVDRIRSMSSKHNDLIAIWVNCRDLTTMHIDRKNHHSIISDYEQQLQNIHIFAFSWIESLEQVEEYKDLYNWVLIWTSFVKSLLPT